MEMAWVFALRGAHVVIDARNMEAAGDAKKLILESIPDVNVDAMKLDLSSLESVREFADNFIMAGLPLNILINNAGVMFCPYQLSADGVELQFATNHLGHFYLTNLLLDKIKSTTKETGTEGRIVNMSSIAHLHTYAEEIQFDGINDESRYNDKKAYGQSKLANILHANELSRRLQIIISVDQGCDRGDLLFSHYFLHALQSSIVLLDSIDAAGTDQDVANKIERFVLQARIENCVVGCHQAIEKMLPWRTLFASAGFVQVQFSNFTETQAECLLKRVQVRGFHVEKRQSSLYLYWQRGELASMAAWSY